jgi:NAD(P)H dehydrogenase (quinone)
MANSKILITGASGATGGHALATLQASGHDVRALVHEEDVRAVELRSSGTEVVVGDLLDIDTVRAALDGVDAAYYVYPLAPGNLAGTVNFAQAAKEAGVKAIVNLSQMTSRRDSLSYAAKDHWLAEQVLNWSGISITHLRPTLFAEWMVYPISWLDYSKKDTLALPFGEGRFAPIASEDQGRTIAAILANPAPHAGKLYQLFGPVELDGYGIAAAMSEELGRQIKYLPITVEQFLESLKKIPPFSSTFLGQHLGAVAEDCQNGITAGTNDNVETLTGRKPLSVQEFVRKNWTAFAVSKLAS